LIRADFTLSPAAEQFAEIARRALSTK